MKLSFFFFLKDLSRYLENSSAPDEKGRSLQQMSNSRQEKVARYKEQKEQERKLKVVKKN